jgi:aminopeptidase N
MRRLAALVLWAGLVCAGCRGLATGPPPVEPREQGDRFPRGYDALSYDLDLSLLATDGTFDGTVQVVIASRRDALAEVDLDAVDLDVFTVTEDGAPRRFRRQGDHLLVALERGGPAGTRHALAIRYRGRYHQPPSVGIARFDDHVYTVFHTRRWMPCDFDPADKATFSLGLAAPPGWKVLGNGAPRVSPADGGGPRVRWVLDVPHAAYLFGFVAGPLAASSRVAAGGIPALDVLASARTPAAAVARLLDETPAMIRFFEEASGVPFPGARYGVAFVGGGAAQELATLSELGDDFAQVWAATPSEDWLAAHELAHQWWGNAATCATWSDLWVQEAFAVFMTAAWKQRRWGQQAYDREWTLMRARYEKARAAGEDQALAAQVVRRKLYYSKGPLVLFALRAEVGEARFWPAVRDFTREATRTSSRTEGLRRTFERAAGHALPIFDRAVLAAGAP